VSRHQSDMASTQQGTAASHEPSPHRTGNFGISGSRDAVPSRHGSTPPARHPASKPTRTAAATEDSRGGASPVHLCIGSSPPWAFRCLHNAPSIVPLSSSNNRNRLAILILTQANPFSMTLPIGSGLELPSHPKYNSKPPASDF